MRRVQHFDYTVAAHISFEATTENEEAGITAFLDNKSHYRLAKKLHKLQLIKVFEGEESIVVEVPYEDTDAVLQVEAKMFGFNFKYGKDENSLKEIGGTQDARVITAPTFIGTGFNGPYIGMYGSSNGEASENSAAFDWFEYAPQDK